MARRAICRFKVTLRGISPPIWRTIEVPFDYTFWALHVAIQDAMGWEDYHLHEFEVPRAGVGSAVLIGSAEPEFGQSVLPSWKMLISEFFPHHTWRAKYIYDFGDCWEHTVGLEAVLPAKRGVKYPRCLKGRRACPPEDCGGVGGYYRLVEILSDPNDDEYEEMLEWTGAEYDPNQFDPKEVVFSDPDDRLRMMFE